MEGLNSFHSQGRAPEALDRDRIGKSEVLCPHRCKKSSTVAKSVEMSQVPRPHPNH